MWLASGCDGGTLQVRTTPPGAKIYFNARPVGVSPCAVNLPNSKEGLPELHVIEARLKGYEPAIRFLDENNRESLSPRTLEISLTPLPEGFQESQLPEVVTAAAGEKSAKADAGSNRFLHRMACEIRVVRVSDGRVMAQASGVVYPVDFSAFSAGLVRQLRGSCSDGRLAVGQLRNRRQTDLCQPLAEELTDLVRREFSFANDYGVARLIPLRNHISEDQLDRPQIVMDPRLAKELVGVRYLVLGGLAESQESMR